MSIVPWVLRTLEERIDASQFVSALPRVRLEFLVGADSLIFNFKLLNRAD
jgi:hypothetical protein